MSGKFQNASTAASIQGGPLFLPPPKKQESHTWGEFLDSSPNVWDSVFLGGGKNSGPPYTVRAAGLDVAHIRLFRNGKKLVTFICLIGSQYTLGD